MTDPKVQWELTHDLRWIDRPAAIKGWNETILQQKWIEVEIHYVVVAPNVQRRPTGESEWRDVPIVKE